MSQQTVELTPDDLYRRCDPAQFSFADTSTLPDLEEVIGQTRAVQAVKFGIGIRRKGYNIFALGPTGTGKHSLIQSFLTEAAATRPVPADWCYVYNFGETHRPKALSLPAGRGAEFRKEVADLVADILTTLPPAFEGEEYRNRRHGIEETFKETQEEAFNVLQKMAQDQGLALLRTANGLGFAPIKEGEVLSPEEYHKLPQAEQDRLEKLVADLQEALQKVLEQVPAWERRLRQQLQGLNRETATFVIDPHFSELRERFAGLDAILAYLDDVHADMIDNVRAFLSSDDDGESAQKEMQAGTGAEMDTAEFLRRYRVNLVVNHADGDQTGLGAPVIYEGTPSYQNLVGRVEYMAQMGTLMTDFMLIKPGALHRANGGYLILDARKVLTQPYAWEGLKRALQFEDIRIESPGQMMNQTSTISLEPDPIPLDVKVVLIGEREIYYVLWQNEPDFGELFKVAADFDEQMDRTLENQQHYARLLGTLARQEGLRPLDPGAVARTIEHSSRLASDSERLSTRMQEMVDLLQEADYWADQEGNGVITERDVQRAIDAQIFRLDRIRERSLEMVLRGTVLVETDGVAVGQINGLAVMQVGNFAFGRPSRITARVSLGKGQVLDIEREVELGGALHSKGVLILSSFLQARYAAEAPFSLSARLVFEQSYGGVDGDSASSAELYCLLSAITGVPIRQSLAVTGSVNQMGQVQAIGGANEKIEGFFDLCTERGLTGEQGVLIPRTNVVHLMLRQDVVEAVAAGRFHIYPIDTIDQGMEILTGVAAGELDGNGAYPDGSINRRVVARLAELAEKKTYHDRKEDDEGNGAQRA